MKFGEDHGLELLGHTLVWHGQTPQWVFAGEQVFLPDAVTAARIAAEREARPNRRRGFDASIPHATRDQLLERMRDHIHTVVGRYKGRVKVWDVVNEAPHPTANGPEVLRESAWAKIIGPDFIAQAFRFAHEADPDAIPALQRLQFGKPP